MKISTINEFRFFQRTNQCKTKQHRCPSTDEWIKKQWYICRMEYYSTFKKSNIKFSGK